MMQSDNSSSLAAPRTERKAWVDMGKGLAMLLVVLFHSEIYFPASSIMPTTVLGYAHMPFFFFLSGYVFCTTPSALCPGRKVRGIVRSLLFTYLVFTSLIVLPKSLMNGTPLSEGLLRIALGQASWFVVALAVCELCYTALLSLTHSLRWVPLFMLLSVVATWGLKRVHPECLPFYLETALLENFFLGLGLLYRAYEAQIGRWVRTSWLSFAFFTLIYLAATALDHRWFNTPAYNYAAVDKPYVNLPLYLVYATLGIAALTLLVKLLPPFRAVLFVGRHSLIVYYLNGGVVRCLVYALSLAGLHVSPAWGCYPATLLMALIASGILGVIAWAINRWCPFLAGDREAFNRVSRRLGFHIRW